MNTITTQKQADPFYKSKEWLGIRQKVLKRDRWSCVVCGCSVKGLGKARVDHIKPRRTHPTLALELSNLRALCPSCDAKRHSEKGSGGVERPTISASGFPPGWE